jgi:type IV pilus assembly protein PilB
MTLRLGDLLVRNGALTESQRDSVLDYQRLTGRPFGELAERLFGVGQQAVEQAWAEQYAAIAQRIDPRAEAVDPEALALIDRRQAWQFRIMPVRFEAAELMLCTTQDHLVRALKFAGWRIRAASFMVLADPLSLGEALMRHYPMAGMNPGVVGGGRLGIA